MHELRPRLTTVLFVLFIARDDLIPRMTTNELVVKIHSFTFISHVPKYNYLSKRLTGNWHVSFISDENFISLDILIRRGRTETIKRQIIVVIAWSVCGIAMFAFVIWWGLRPREVRKKTRREEERKRDVTPWEPTVPFHGFCSVKVIRYYNESTLLALRRYPCSRSARDRELIDRGHLFGTTALSRVCRSLVEAVTQSQSASKVNTYDIFHLEELWHKAKCREGTWRAKEMFDTLTKRHFDTPYQKISSITFKYKKLNIKDWIYKKIR